MRLTDWEAHDPFRIERALHALCNVLDAVPPRLDLDSPHARAGLLWARHWCDAAIRRLQGWRMIIDVAIADASDPDDPRRS
jgi:hypothetical protein